MDLVIVNINEKIFEGELKKIFLPTVSGDIEILPGHTPFLAPLKKGIIKYIDGEEKEQKLEIENGFVEVNKNKTIIIL